MQYLLRQPLTLQSCPEKGASSTVALTNTGKGNPPNPLRAKSERRKCYHITVVPDFPAFYKHHLGDYKLTYEWRRRDTNTLCSVLFDILLGFCNQMLYLRQHNKQLCAVN